MAACLLLDTTFLGGQAVPATPAIVHDVRGVVLDGISGRPLPRVLVALNQRRLLTDAFGRFDFASVADGAIAVTLRKPGYSSAEDGGPGASAMTVTDPDKPVTLKMLPYARLLGLVSDRAGHSLAGVEVTVARAQWSTDGLHAQEVGFAISNSHGAFRMVVPSGRLRVTTRYIPSDPATGDAFLPASFPQESESSASGFVRVAAGEERQVELRVRNGRVQYATLRLPDAESHGGLRVEVSPATGPGFTTEARGAGKPGDYLLGLPAGSYRLRLASGRETPASGLARVTLPGPEGEVVTVAMAPLTLYPVEVQQQVAPAGAGLASGASTTPITAQQLGLRLQPVDRSPDPGEDLQLHNSGDTASFRLAPGRYRLSASGGGSMAVISASCGSGNLLTGELVAGPGSAGTPIRLTVSTKAGSLAVMAQLPDGQLAATAYMLPQEPGLVPFYSVRVTAQKTATRQLPPGHYLVFLTASAVDEDLRDQQVAGRYTRGAQVVEITAGGKTSVTLTPVLSPRAVL